MFLFTLVAEVGKNWGTGTALKWWHFPDTHKHMVAFKGLSNVSFRASATQEVYDLMFHIGSNKRTGQLCFDFFYRPADEFSVIKRS